jgi:hypothetical protein
MRSNDNVAYRDIWFDDIPLNDQTDDLICLVTNVDGWWGPPESDIPEDTKTYTEDGNYTVPGRYLSRTVEIEGVVLAQKPGSDEGLAAIYKWRDNLVNSLNKIRKTGTLTFFEDSGTKQLKVQISDRPIFEFKKRSNTLNYNIQFYAADPNKYNSKLTKKSVAISEKTPNFITGAEETAKDIEVTTTGRTYHDEVVSETESYAVFPRTYNTTALFWDSKDNRYSAQITVLNEGDTTTYGTIVMNGPVTNPAVKHLEQAKYLLFNRELSDTETITIDLQEKTAVLNDEDSTSVLTDLDFSSSWFNFYPGVNTLTFYGDDVKVEQIGWAAATNYVTNPSVELTTDDTTYTAFTDLFDYSVQAKNISVPNLISDIDSTANDGTTPSFISSVTGATAQLSSWFGATYDEADKSLAVQTTVEEGGESYAELDVTLEAGNTYIFKANIFNDAVDTHQTYHSALYVQYNSTTLYQTIDTTGTAQIVFTLPETVTSYSLRLYNGYNAQTAYNDETETYEETDNIVYFKDITVTESVIPDSTTYTASTFFEPTVTASAVYVDKYNTKVYGYNNELLKLTNVTIPTDNYFTFLANMTSDVTATVALVCRDTTPLDNDAGTYPEPDFTYPPVTLTAGVEKLVVMRMAKPDFDFNMYLNVSASSSNFTLNIENPNLVNGKLYGGIFNETTAGISDAQVIASGNSYALTRTIPYGYEPTIVAVDDLATYDGTIENTLRKTASFAYEGTYGMALSSLQDDIDGYVEAIKVTCVDWTSIANGPITVYATVKAAGTYFKSYLHTCSIGVLSNGTAYYSESAALDNDTHTLVLHFTKTSNDVELYLLGGSIGSSETYFDAILVTSGDYNDRYFQGGMEQATWKNTEHKSISTQTYKETIPGSVTEVYYRDAWIT